MELSEFSINFASPPQDNTLSYSKDTLYAGDVLSTECLDILNTLY